MLEISGIPTVELHRHWEAGMSPETIATIAGRNRIDRFKRRDGSIIEGVDPQDPESVRKYAAGIVGNFKGPNGFGDFLNAFRAVASIFRTEEDIEQAIFEQLRDEQAAGSIHTELRGSPISLRAPLAGIPVVEVLLAMRSGVRRAYDELGMSGAITACFSREKGIDPSGDIEKDQAQHVVDAVLQLSDIREPIGLDIAGSPEDKFPPEMFKDVLAPAVEAGIPITVHAGEQVRPPDFIGAPAKFVEDAVLKLGARRIGHGVSLMDPSAESARVKDLLIRRRVGIETCPISNDLLGVVGLDEHPLRSFLDQGLMVSAATDDPLWFGVGSVREMLEKNGARLGLTDHDVWRMTRSSIEMAFVSEKRRMELRRKFADISEGIR